MKQITATKTTITIKDLTIHPFLAKYGITEITDFEAAQYKKFSLPPGDVICTKNNDVLYNYEAVETARKIGLKTLDVTVLDIDTDTVIQVVSFKNMRRRLSRRQQAELIVELRKYMDETKAGKEWKKEIDGDEINKKIGFLVGYSYGMVNQLERIYKYNPDLLIKIDNGKMTFTEAANALPKPPKQKENAPDKQPGTKQPNPPTNNTNQAGDTLSSHGEPTKGASKPTENCTTDEGIAPQKVNTENWDLAGERNTEPCEDIKELVIKFASGKEVKLVVQDRNVDAKIFGKSTSDVQYQGGKQHKVDGTKYHLFKSAQDSQIQIVFYNDENLAA